MEVLNNLLESEAVLSAIAILVAAVWSAVKSSEFFRTQKLERYAAAIGIIEASVQQTYENYVRAMKAKNGGKLPDDARKIALHMATQGALKLGTEHGVDVLGILKSERLVATEVQHAVNAAKRG